MSDSVGDGGATRIGRVYIPTAKPIATVIMWVTASVRIVFFSL